MSYRCELCQAPCPPKQARLVHVVYRPDGSVLREVPVCRGCKAELAAGASPGEIARREWVDPGTPAPAPALPSFVAAGPVLLGRRVASRAPNGLGPHRYEPAPRCDVCGAGVGVDGQRTADTVLCLACLERTAKGGGV